MIEIIVKMPSTKPNLKMAARQLSAYWFAAT